MHIIVLLLNNVGGSLSADDREADLVFFQVLTAQRTIVVDLPADQQVMHTFRMDVNTIAMDDSMTDGSLIAELTAAPGSSIKLGNARSEVEILHDNFGVTVTGPGGASSVIADENSSATLVLNVTTPAIDQDRDVNLSYTNVISGEMETISITVPAGSTSRDFSIFVGDDDIAAQPTRNFRVSLVQGDSFVDINVLNDDSAVVSILPVSDTITEGDSAVFEVQVSNKMSVDLTVTINLAITGGNFRINPGPGNHNVVITEGKTTALLTVMTTGDEIGEAYGSLTAEIVSPLNLPESISGVKPTRSTVNPSATVTILDDDLSVRITTLDDDDQANTTVSESDNEVSLRLVLSAAINRPLQVNLSYAGDLGLLATDATTVVTVPIGNISRNFSIRVENDDIAAQSTRFFTVLLEPDINYIVGTPSSVAVSVLDDDVATVSISALDSAITAGESAVFELTLDFATAVAATVEVRYTHENAGPFLLEDPLDSVVVTFAAGETSTRVAVDTMVGADATVDGLLIAQLIAVPGSPIEPGSPDTSEVAIWHTNLVVTVTTSDSKSSISVNEGSDVDLVINVDPPVPDLRSLDVNLSYVDVISNTMETMAITVLAGSTSQDFQISVGDDDIAAQTTRFFNVSITPDINYAVGTPSSVAVSVLDNDTAVVSILPPLGSIVEGQPALFEVQVDKEIAVTLTVTIDLSLAITGGDFGISSSANVVIDAGKTTVLLTVETDDDEIGEAYGSLTATIVSLDSQEPVSGPLMISANNSSAMATILDNDLIVSITTSDNIIQDSTTVSESDEVSLHLILSDAINRPLQVNLSYAGDTGLLATGAPTVVEVPANTTTHPFTVTINDDRIAAQPDRSINISVDTGGGYTESADPVTVIVEDDDIARVSISAQATR